MQKIYIDTVEPLCCCIIFPVWLGIGVTFLIIVDPNISFVEEGLICYAILAGMLIISLAIYLIFFLNKKYLLVDGTSIIIVTNGREKKYLIKEIAHAEYFKCKWYMLPFIMIYKEEQGGLIHLQTDELKNIKFTVLYKDFKKLKQFVQFDKIS